MLRRLRIQNHALIQEVDLTLDAGFHVFTGETGSGKSIVLGALGLLLGSRADSSSVGLHGDRATIEGEFIAPQLSEWLQNADLPDAMCIHVRREVLRNGRSRVFINDAQASVGQLREFGSRLVSIHHQDDVSVSLDRSVLCNVLDAFGDHDDIKSAYDSTYSHWVEAQRQLEKLEALARTPSGDVNYLKHQISELDNLQLQDIRWDSLTAELKSLQHAQELHEGLGLAARNIDGEDSGGMTSIDAARRALSNLEGIDDHVDEMLHRIQSLRIELQDISSTLWDLVESKQPDPRRLMELESQYDAVMHSMRKHRVEHPEELLSLRDNLQNQVSQLDSLEEQLRQTKLEATNKLHLLEASGEALNTARKKAGAHLVDRVLPLIAQLKMPHARMAWKFLECEPDALGMAIPEVWFTSNPGSTLLPLTKVASGGERARFMLALKSVLAEIQSTSVVVLDEIDTGVSGEVAMHMGQTMKAIAHAPQTQQVLAVTHLPQVAALAEHHWEVRKTTDGATTHVMVHELNSEERQHAVATMLSGTDVTPEALSQAERLMTPNA